MSSQVHSLIWCFIKVMHPWSHDFEYESRMTLYMMCEETSGYIWDSESIIWRSCDCPGRERRQEESKSKRIEETTESPRKEGSSNVLISVLHKTRRDSLICYANPPCVLQAEAAQAEKEKPISKVVSFTNQLSNIIIIMRYLKEKSGDEHVVALLPETCK